MALNTITIGLVQDVVVQAVTKVGYTQDIPAMLVAVQAEEQLQEL